MQHEICFTQEIFCLRAFSLNNCLDHQFFQYYNFVNIELICVKRFFYCFNIVGDYTELWRVCYQRNGDERYFRRARE